jgi:hypothetical protein
VREGCTYRVIGLARLAEGLRCVVDFFNHLSEILVELVEPVLELLGKLVSVCNVSECCRNQYIVPTYVLSRS